MSNIIQKFEAGLTKDFRTAVTKLEQDLISIADGENIIMGNEDKPILNDCEQVPLNHYFMDGVYVRAMKMYKGRIVIGAIHKDLHMCFLLEGHLTVANEDGVIDYIAPCFVVSKPGVKRVLFAHEDSVWYNTHRNPSGTKNIEQLENELVCINYKEYEKYINNKNK